MVNARLSGPIPPSFFAQNAKWQDLAREIAGTGELTALQLRDAMTREEVSPDRKKELAAMLRALQGGAPANSVRGEVGIRAAAVEAAPPKLVDEDVVRYRDFLDTRIVGQADAKDVAARFYKVTKSKLKLQKKPLVKLLVGPPGVGKTSISAAEAEACHGRPDAMLFIDCASLTDITQLGKVTGIGRGYSGWDKECLFSPENIQRKFGDKRPVIIHIDEPDKMPPDIASRFWAMFNNFLQTGNLDIDGKIVELGGNVIVNIATNSGHDTSKGLTGEARRQHYRDKGSAALAAHTDSRIEFVAAFDPLTLEDRRKIARLEVEKVFVDAKAQLQKTGRTVGVEVTQDVCDLVARLAANDDYGARPISSMVSQVLSPIIDDILGAALDEERYQLCLARSMTDIEIAPLEALFRNNKGRVPAGVEAADFGMQMVLKNPPPQLFDYPSDRIPANEFGGRMRMFGSGVVGGRSFLLYNRDDLVSSNELRVLRPGRVESEDSFIPVSLPDDLAAAHFVYSTAIEDPPTKDEAPRASRVMMVGISIPTEENAKQPKQCAYIWEPGADVAFTKVAPPPVALGDASLGSVAGQVILWGGRRILKDKVTGDWTTSSGVPSSVGMRIENQAYAFDTSTKEWDVVNSVPKTGRCCAATVNAGGTLAFIGGEQVVGNPHGVHYSRASTEVDFYDPKSKSFRSGPELREGLAYAGAYLDDFGRIRVIGGAELHDNGFELVERGAILGLDPHLPNATWKDRGDLGVVGRDLISIPHPRGGVVLGPFYRADGETTWKLERAPTAVVK